MKFSPEIEILNTTDSTNTVLKAKLAEMELPEFYALLARNQIAGRGQMAQSWHSEAGKNLTISVVIYPDCEISNQFFLSKIVSCVLVEYLSELGKPFTIKWPNDIYFQDKKIAGILTENTLSVQKIKQSVVGIGLNVNQTEFPENLPNPISLKSIFQKTFDIEEIASNILERVFLWFKKFKNGQFEEINEYYHQNLLGYRREIRFLINSEACLGYILGTSTEGKLVVGLQNQIVKEFDLKEIKFLFT